MQGLFGGMHLTLMKFRRHRLQFLQFIEMFREFVHKLFLKGSRSSACKLSKHAKLNYMPEKKTIKRAQKDKRQGKSASTQAGEFVREEIHHIREGNHGARSAKQAVAIGLSKARRAGVDLKPPKKGQASEKTRR